MGRHLHCQCPESVFIPLLQAIKHFCNFIPSYFLGEICILFQLHPVIVQFAFDPSWLYILGKVFIDSTKTVFYFAVFVGKVLINSTKTIFYVAVFVGKVLVISTKTVFYFTVFVGKVLVNSTKTVFYFAVFVGKVLVNSTKTVFFFAVFVGKQHATNMYLMS